jgi:hypothetical protein
MGDRRWGREEEEGSHARSESRPGGIETQRRREEKNEKTKNVSHPLGDSLEGTEGTERRVRRTATFLLR